MRFRHPKAAPINTATVNHEASSQFDKHRDVVELVGLTVKAVVAGCASTEFGPPVIWD
jgi:hypothetical protein